MDGLTVKTDKEERLLYERQFAAKGVRFLGGVDEAGRGPLAGPVVAACVVFDPAGAYPDADDSKKLTERQRERLYEEILPSCLAYGIGLCDAAVIDEINILQATYRAMREAVSEAERRLGRSLEALLVDFVHIPELRPETEQCSVTHGDALSVSIGAASVLAKVTRDRLMKEYAKQYPGYGFEKHKGYGTKAHYEAIRQQGLTPLHRRSFLKNLGQHTGE